MRTLGKLLLPALMAALLLVSACNTMEGLGQDIQKGGEKLEESADRHK